MLINYKEKTLHNIHNITLLLHLASTAKENARGVRHFYKHQQETYLRLRCVFEDRDFSGDDGRLPSRFVEMPSVRCWCRDDLLEPSAALRAFFSQLHVVWRSNPTVGADSEETVMGLWVFLR